jgi:hypothetical protein
MTTIEKPFGGWIWLAVVVAVIGAMNTIEPVAHYFEHRWPLVSLGAAACIWVFVSAHGREAWADPTSRAVWLLFSAYLLHGFEVDGVDLLGREFYFQTHVAETRGIELTAGDIMRMNTVSIWLIFICAVWGGKRFPWAGLAAGGVTLANGLMHTMNSLVLGEYNPGLATSLTLFLPGATLYLLHLRRVLGLSHWALGGAVAFGVFGHAALLPVCVALHSPLWLMAGFAVTPLAANALAVRFGVGGISSSPVTARAH